METITSALYDERRKTAERSRELRQSADLHRDIYRAVRSRNSSEARSVMERHLSMAQSAQELEPSADGSVSARRLCPPRSKEVGRKSQPEKEFR
jgi:GntR family transcriptional repressor for pyruvate dehydrogenase complex